MRAFTSVVISGSTRSRCMTTLPGWGKSMLYNNKYQKEQNFLHEEDHTTQAERHSHKCLHARNPKEVVNLVSAYFTNI